MKRTPKMITERCPMCHRDGWQRIESFSLWTEEEWKAFGDSGDDIPDAPADAERCIVRSGYNVYAAVTEGIALAKALGKPVAFLFNDTPVILRADSDTREAIRAWGRNRSQDGHVLGAGSVGGR